MTIHSGMRPIRRRVPASIEDGGTGARTAAEAVEALGVPSLDGDNTFTGTNSFARVWSDTIGTDGDLTASTSASTEFPAPTPEQPFIAFDDLTEATVIGWVEECADAAYLESRREVIAGVVAALEHHRGAEGYELPAASWCITAVRPD